MTSTTTTIVSASGSSSVQQMLRKFEATNISDTPKPRAGAPRKAASFRTNTPTYAKLRHRNSEGRIGLQRSRPVSTHVSPLLRERPPVLKRNAALKARVSDRVREMEQQNTDNGDGNDAEPMDGSVVAGNNAKKGNEDLLKSRLSNGDSRMAEVKQSSATNSGESKVCRVLEPATSSRQVLKRTAGSGTSLTYAGKKVWRRPLVAKHKPLVRVVASESNNNAAECYAPVKKKLNGPLAVSSISGSVSSSLNAKPELSRVEANSESVSKVLMKPLPPGPPPPKPPRTFEHDVYVATRQPASLGSAPVPQSVDSTNPETAGSDRCSSAEVIPSEATTVTIRRSSSATKPSIARKPSDLGALRNSSFLETFIPRSGAHTSASEVRKTEHIYAEPSVSVARPRDLPPPPPPTTPPPPPPERRLRRRSGGGLAPYAVSTQLRRSASDETLYATLGRQHVYERLPGEQRTMSISSSSSSPPPGLRRHPAFKRTERPSLKRNPLHPGPPPPPALSRLAREAGDVMGCQLGGSAATEDSGRADQERETTRSQGGWRAGALAVRRRNYLRRVSTMLGGRRAKSPPEITEKDRLYDALLVVALSADPAGKLTPCVLSKYPPEVELEADVAPFCFPDAARWQRAPDLWGRSCCDGGAAYHLVVTDQHGARRFGYCRRLTAETADGEVTLPIAYCLLTRHNAAAFYSRLLTAIMQHHGTGEQLRQQALQQLQLQPFPAPGGSVAVLAAEPDAGPAQHLYRSNSFTQCLPGSGRPATLEVRRPLDARLDEVGLYQLVRRLGVDLFIQLFSSTLLERKVILYSQHLSVLSAAVAALQSALCPFKWQHVLVPVVPSHLAEVLSAPSPLIMGALPDDSRPQQHTSQQEDAICVDLDGARVLQSTGDETTILPRRLSRSLAEALRLAAWLPGAEPHPASAAVLLAEMLLRMFVEVCGHYRDHLATQQDGKTIFQRDSFVEAAPSDEVREFLSWFTETAMFNAFVESCEQHTEGPEMLLFDRRILERHPDLESSIQSLLRSTRQLGKSGGVCGGGAGIVAGRFKWKLNT